MLHGNQYQKNHHGGGWGEGNGFYERLIAILKSALQKVVRSAKLIFRELHTVLVQMKT